MVRTNTLIISVCTQNTEVYLYLYVACIINFACFLTFVIVQQYYKHSIYRLNVLECLGYHGYESLGDFVLFVRPAPNTASKHNEEYLKLRHHAA